MIVPDAVVTAILPAETVKLSFTVNVPLTIVVIVPLPRFTVFAVGVDDPVPVPIFIPPANPESHPIRIDPVVRFDDPPPRNNVPVV